MLFICKAQGAKNFRNFFVYRRFGWKSFGNQNYEKQLIIILAKCLFSHEEIPLQRFCVHYSVPYLIVFTVISTDSMFYVIRSSTDNNRCIIINVGVAIEFFGSGSQSTTCWTFIVLQALSEARFMGPRKY